jgi:hypothetical protein
MHEFYVKINDEPEQKLTVKTDNTYLVACAALTALIYDANHNRNDKIEVRKDDVVTYYSYDGNVVFNINPPLKNKI